MKKMLAWKTCCLSCDSGVTWNWEREVWSDWFVQIMKVTSISCKFFLTFFFPSVISCWFKSLALVLIIQAYGTLDDSFVFVCFLLFFYISFHFNSIHYFFFFLTDTTTAALPFLKTPTIQQSNTLSVCIELHLKTYK